MARVLIVTDSSACVPASGVHALHDDVGRIVPITILLGDVENRDDTIDPALVYGALARDEPVKSSPPSAVDYLEAIEHGSFDGALVLTPSAEFTVMANHARLAATLSARPVKVLDTRTAAAAQGLVVSAAAAAARAGADLDEVAAVAHDAATRVELVAALDSVDAIERSGRVSPPALAAATRLGVRPLFRFRDGRIAPLEPGTGDAETLETLRAAWVAGDGPAATTTVVFHAAAKVGASRLRELLGGEPPVVKFSPAMAIHTGPGVVGAAWLRPPAPVRP